MTLYIDWEAEDRYTYTSSPLQALTDVSYMSYLYLISYQMIFY